MRAHFGLPSVSNEEDKKDRPPITVKFEIPYFTVSGIQALIIIVNLIIIVITIIIIIITTITTTTTIMIIIRHLKIIEKSDLLRTYSQRTSDLLLVGPIPQDHREERVPGAAMGAVHHTERRLPAADGLAPRPSRDRAEIESHHRARAAL